MGTRTIDVTGQRFGRLVAVEQLEPHRNARGIAKNSRWRCRCDCGNEKIVFGGNLRNGTTWSCGCARHADLVGQVFARLTVVELAYIQGQKAQWRCLCTCGAEPIVHTAALRNGATKSCGCLNREEWIKNPTRKKVFSYPTAHRRVRVARGSVSDYPCVDCGKPAEQWSYDGLDPAALRDTISGCLYSLKVDHYHPRCIPCHTTFDRQAP